MTSYRPAPAVERIATTLIGKYHAHLSDVEIRYCFRDKAAKSKGQTVWGKARKVSGLNAYLAHDQAEDGADAGDDDFFVIEIAEDVWVVLNDKQRTALVDHELAHCSIDYDDENDTIKLVLRAHDLEEFREVVERHGLWRPEISEFVNAVQQQTLDLDPDLAS